MQTFDQFGLSPELLRAVESLKYTTPTPIQIQTLPLLLGKPTDFIGLAATGTGKTAAFGLPVLEKIDTKNKAVQALVLCPTRELAMQVTDQIHLLGKYKDVRALAIYGGAGYAPQLSGLAQGVSIVVGTPGRVIDHLERGSLKLHEVSTVILDEADEMISMGFKDELEAILKAIPKEKSKIWLFSATMNKEVRRVADTYLKNPAQIQVNRTEMLSTTVEQVFYMTKEADKPEVLCKLIEAAEDFYGIVFCQTKQLVSNLTQYLIQRGYKVDCLHGDMDQKARERTMLSFRNKNVSILICTDVASRGLDVKDVTHVVNYSIPRELDSYVHRIGRTARSGKAGIAMSLVGSSHLYLIDRIEKMTKSRMTEGRIPTRREIGIKRISKILPQFLSQTSQTRVMELLSDDWKSAIAEMDRNEIVSRFVAILAADVFEDRQEKVVVMAPLQDREDRDQGQRRPQQHRRHERQSNGPRKFSKARGGKPATAKTSYHR